MARPITLFTGQWADLPLEEGGAVGLRVGLRRPRARLLGRPPDPWQGAVDDDCIQSKLDLFDRYGLKLWATASFAAAFSSR